MNWMDGRTAFALALIASLGLVLGSACSDDEVDEGENQQTTEDVEDIDDDAGLDTGEPDDVEEDLDTESDDVEEDAEDDVEEDVEDDADAGPEGLDPVFDVEPVECSFPSDDPNCPQADFGPASFFSEFVIETDDDEDACCIDISGDGQIDNFIGETVVDAVSGISGFGDINQNIVASIGSGELLYLMEAKHWQHPMWEGDMDLRVYMGGSTNASMSDNLAGEGIFTLSPTNFDEDGEPRFGFEQVEIRDGHLTARDGFIEVMFPGLVEAIAAQLGAVEISAEVVQDPEPDLSAGGHFALTNGTLGGAILRDQFFKSINEEALMCDCLELDDYEGDEPDLWADGLFNYYEAQDRWICDWKSAAASTCQDPEEPVECQTLGYRDLCTMLAAFSGQTDVEVDGEPSFSIGIRFESVTTEIRGIDE